MGYADVIERKAQLEPKRVCLCSPDVFGSPVVVKGCLRISCCLVHITQISQCGCNLRVRAPPKLTPAREYFQVDGGCFFVVSHPVINITQIVQRTQKGLVHCGIILNQETQPFFVVRNALMKGSVHLVTEATDVMVVSHQPEVPLKRLQSVLAGLKPYLRFLIPSTADGYLGRGTSLFRGNNETAVISHMLDEGISLFQLIRPHQSVHATKLGMAG